jgi:hypothetical protein
MALSGRMHCLSRHGRATMHRIVSVSTMLFVILQAGDCGSGGEKKADSVKGMAGDSKGRSAPNWLKSEKLFKSERVALFLRGSSTSERVTKALKAIHELKKPNSCFLSKKGEMSSQGGADPSSLEKFCERYGASFLGLASHTKRRPDNLHLARLYNGKILDSFDLAVLPNGQEGSKEPVFAHQNMCA